MRPAMSALIANVTAGQIKPAFHFEPGNVLNMLRQQLTQHDLLGEVFSADDRMVRTRGRAGRDQ